VRDRVKEIIKNILPIPFYRGGRKLWRALRGSLDNVLRLLRSRSGVIARFARYPRPLSAPRYHNLLDVGRKGGIGDVLMCTPALRELKLKNPRSYIRFYTDFPALVRGLPYIDEVLAYGERPNEAIILQYEDAMPPRAHLARIIGDNLGLDVRSVRPDCVIDPELVECFRRSWRSRPRIAGNFDGACIL
jgi:hypothetical protein